jgi:methionine-rich copper-binding protein CopC
MTKQRIKICCLLPVLAILAILLSGCGKTITQTTSERAAEKIIEQQTGGQAKVDVNQGNVKVESKDGNIEVGQNVKLPADFPKDVYVIDGNLVSAFSEPTKGTFTVSIQTEKSPAQAAAEYQEKLSSDGWKITGNMNFGGTFSVIAEKDDRIATAMVSASDNKTTVIISTGKK